MKLWILHREKLDTDSDDDDISACLVRAETENDARRLVKVADLAEDSDWLDPMVTFCEEIMPEGKSALLLVTYICGNPRLQ